MYPDSIWSFSSASGKEKRKKKTKIGKVAQPLKSGCELKQHLNSWQCRPGRLGLDFHALGSKNKGCLCEEGWEEKHWVGHTGPHCTWLNMQFSLGILHAFMKLQLHLGLFSTRESLQAPGNFCTLLRAREESAPRSQLLLSQRWL